MAINNCIYEDDVDQKYDNFILIIEKVIGMSVSEKVKSATLAQLGINSIQYISIIVEVEALFDMVFDEEKLVMSEFETFWDIYIYVKNSSRS